MYMHHFYCSFFTLNIRSINASNILMSTIHVLFVVALLILPITTTAI